MSGSSENETTSAFRPASTARLWSPEAPKERLEADALAGRGLLELRDDLVVDDLRASSRRRATGTSSPCRTRSCRWSSRTSRRRRSRPSARTSAARRAAGGIGSLRGALQRGFGTGQNTPPSWWVSGEINSRCSLERARGRRPRGSARPPGTARGRPGRTASKRFGQRGWKRQPRGRLAASGSSPPSAVRCSAAAAPPRPAPACRDARDARSRRAASPCSTIRPRYMTAMRSHSCQASDRSWVMNSSASSRDPLELEQHVQDLRAHGDVEHRDRLVADEPVGLEHERRRDRHALALAAGELVRVAVAVARRREPDLLERAPTRAACSAFATPVTTSGSATIVRAPAGAG